MAVLGRPMRGVKIEVVSEEVTADALVLHTAVTVARWRVWWEALKSVRIGRIN